MVNPAVCCGAEGSGGVCGAEGFQVFWPQKLATTGRRLSTAGLIVAAKGSYQVVKLRGLRC